MKQKEIFSSGTCPNCNTELKPEHRFCPECGQKRLKPDDFSFRHFVIHSIVDYFHIDGGFFKSIVPLLFKPGWLTKKYLEGKRMQYIHPFKMLLFLTIVYFLLISIDNNKSGDKTDKIKEQKYLNLGNKPEDKLILTDSIIEQINKQGIERYVDSVEPDANWFVRQIAIKSIKAGNTDNDILFSKETYIHKSTKLVFVLIPLLALILKLLYIRRKKLYYDHLIFSVHVHSFLFLILTLYAVSELLHIAIAPNISDFISYIAFGIILVYLYIALKNVYMQSYIKTFVKFNLLLIMYLFIAVIPFFIILLMSSLFF